MITLLIKKPLDHTFSQQSWHELLELITLQALFGQPLSIIVLRESQGWLATSESPNSSAPEHEQANEQGKLLWQSLLEMQPKIFWENSDDNLPSFNGNGGTDIETFERSELSALLSSEHTESNHHFMVF